MNEDWITTDEAAAILGVTREWVCGLVVRGCIVGHRAPPADGRATIGRRVSVSRKSAQEYKNAGKRETMQVLEDASRPGDILCPWCQRGVASEEDLCLHADTVHPRLLELKQLDAAHGSVTS